MDLTAATARAYLHHGFDQVVVVAERLGDELVNRRPHGPHTNSIAALVTHCCGVTEFWLGHVGLGRTSDRHREAEFTATATVAELRSLIDVTLRQADADVEALANGQGTGAEPELRADLPGDGSDVALVLHVIEELFQHLGQMELTVDALRGG